MRLCGPAGWRNFSKMNPAAPLSNFLAFRKLRRRAWLLPLGLLLLGGSARLLAADIAAARFHKEIQPLLTQYCSDCHMDGMKKGGVSFDEVGSDKDLLAKRDLWLAVLQNVRAGLMPPPKKDRPTAAEQQRLADWIKFDAFRINRNNLDPGRVTVRRLNRVEYRNTIRDLMDVEYNTAGEFPPDDTGYGFDNIGDVLTVSPMLLEKYLVAARAIVSEAVPSNGRTMPERIVYGNQFKRADGVAGSEEPRRNRREGNLLLSYYERALATNSFRAEHAGRYKLTLNLAANERFVENAFDYNKCRLIFRVDGQELWRREFSREIGQSFHHEVERDWKEGSHDLVFELEPLTPDQKQVRSLSLRIDSVVVRGPDDKQYWVRPRNHERWFPKDAPEKPAARRVYAGELLKDFASRAFRRPVDEETVSRLVSLAESVYSAPGKSFEAGVAHAMVAVLASPRFLFREEDVEPKSRGQTYASLDEYSLASRLSYFLWSSMPDAELTRLAGAHQLRANLGAQVKRMLADSRSRAFIQNFTGQWLQARDVETVVIDARAVLAREERVDPERDRLRARFRELRNKPEEELTEAEKDELKKMRGEFFRRFGTPRVELTGELRQAMRQETEKYFEHIIRQDRPLLELIDSDYSFLNERLAKHYGVDDVRGDELRLVHLPPGSVRGGILTQGSVLAVTSNPTRTSPVKRGLFVLDNILGMPPPPPPPDIPPLEDAAKGVKDHEPSLRETLELHRQKPLCSSCHNRMDPLGLALENFNAMGMWRDHERGQAVEVSGKLMTGESFADVRELKKLLAEKHSRDFYHCLTEKLLTYALGRGLDYYDVETVDVIVGGVEKEGGRFSALLNGIIESAPFQKRRDSAMIADTGGSHPSR
jgi:hypothetical protein